MKRSREDMLGNLLLIKFLMEYWDNLDNSILDRAAATKDPADLPPDIPRVLSAMEGFLKDMSKIAEGQKNGEDTRKLEEDMLTRFTAELNEKAKFAVSRSSPQEVAGLVPRAFLFKGLEGMLKKFGGAKIVALVALNERQRNFDDSLDNPPSKKQKPPKPS